MILFFGLAQNCLSKAMSQELVHLVAMLAFVKEDFVAKRDHFQILDFFAGAARITVLAQGLGLAAAKLDKDMAMSCDMNTNAGFVWLVPKLKV